MNLWSTPKTTWASPDLVAAADLNRNENNVEAVRDGAWRQIQGYGFTIDNSVSGQDGVVTVLAGACFSSDGYAMRSDVSWTKNLNTWSAGNGPTYGGVVSGASVGANTWLYLFIVLDPTTGNLELMIDDNRAGSNISSGTYTKKRLINCIKTGAAGSYSSYLLVEMYSTGDRTYVNPESLLPSQHYLGFSNSVGIDNTYQLITLQDGTYGLLLPNVAVEARLNLWYYDMTVAGLVSRYPSVVFSVPAQVYTATNNYFGEYVHVPPGTTDTDLAEIMVEDNGTLYLGMYGNTTTGAVAIVPISYTWDRKVYGI